MWPEQCFVLGHDVLDAASFEEVDATFADMAQLDLARPPYKRFDIVVPLSKVVLLWDSTTDEKIPAPDTDGTLRVRFTEDAFQWLMTKGKHTFDLTKGFADCARSLGAPNEPDPQAWERSANALRRLLIVLLATKNVVKERQECKSVRLGIGASHKNRYTTTLKIGRVVEHTERHSEGSPKRPHLRRGHIRRQHHGPNNELVKQVFIEPVFVNADKGWIADRTAYNVGLASPTLLRKNELGGNIRQTVVSSPNANLENRT